MKDIIKELTPEQRYDLIHTQKASPAALLAVPLLSAFTYQNRDL